MRKFVLKFMAASFKTLDWMALQLPATPVCIGIQSMLMEFVETDIMKYKPFSDSTVSDMHEHH